MDLSRSYIDKNRRSVINPELEEAELLEKLMQVQKKLQKAEEFKIRKQNLSADRVAANRERERQH